MNTRIETITTEATEAIRLKELIFNNVITNAPEIVALLESGLEELKKIVSAYDFQDPAQEINFFKNQKPQLLSKLLFYHKVYHIELKRPSSGKDTQKDYFEKELEQINAFWYKKIQISSNITDQEKP